MELKIDTDVLKKAISTWGNISQREMVKEECLELALALQKMNRYDGDAHTAQQRFIDLIDETADVLIMMEQLKIMLESHSGHIQSRIDFKIERLKKRLQL